MNGTGVRKRYVTARVSVIICSGQCHEMTAIGA